MYKYLDFFIQLSVVQLARLLFLICSKFKSYMYKDLDHWPGSRTEDRACHTKIGSFWIGVHRTSPVFQQWIPCRRWSELCLAYNRMPSDRNLNTEFFYPHPQQNLSSPLSLQMQWIFIQECMQICWIYTPVKEGWK